MVVLRSMDVRLELKPLEINRIMCIKNKKEVISIVKKWFERIIDNFSFTPIKDEFREIEKQMKQNKKDIEFLEIEIELEENLLFFLKGKMEQIQKDCEQLEIWKKRLKNKIELKKLEIIDVSTGEEVSKKVELKIHTEKEESAEIQ